MSEKLFLSSYCAKCDRIDELELALSGPHVKGSCQHCKFYQKFVPFNMIPAVDELKIKMWGMVGGDVGVINLAKKDVTFIDTGLSDIQLKVMYWKLYLRIRQILTHAAL